MLSSPLLPAGWSLDRCVILQLMQEATQEPIQTPMQELVQDAVTDAGVEAGMTTRASKCGFSLVKTGREDLGVLSRMGSEERERDRRTGSFGLSSL